MAYDDALAKYTADEDRLAVAERERAAFMDSRNQARKELDEVRRRMNELAVHCDRLEKENARLRDNGRTNSYIQDLRALTQLAVDVGIPDAESTGHGTLVVQLREKFRANQEAADVLRLLEAGKFTLRPCAGNWVACDNDRDNEGTTVARAVQNFCKAAGITLPAKEDNHSADARKMVSPEPAAESEWRVTNAHEQLADARAELADLRRDREAWEAVRKHNILVLPGTLQVDPIEAVLELAKTLEKGG